MSVYKPAKSRFWHFDFQYRGDRFHGSTGVENRRAAEEVERRKRRAAALGELDVDDIPTLHQAASAWWRDHAQHLRASETAWRRIGTCLRLFGKDTKIPQIDQGVIQRAVQKRRRETFTRTGRKVIKGKRVEAKRYPVQPATVNADVVDLMRRVLNHAATDPRIGKLLPSIDWKRLRLKEPEAGFRLYTAERRAAWRAQCDDTAGQALDFLLTYGPRFGEIFFRPSAYSPGDAEAGLGPYVMIDKRKRGLMVLPLRSDDARWIAARVSRALAADLDHIWFEQGPGGKLVEVTYYGLQSRIRSAAKRAGLTMPRLIHGARHHAGTMILHRTQNQRMPQQLLGHADPRSSTRYAHVLNADLRAALEQESRNSPEAVDGEDGFSVPKQARRGVRPKLS